MQIGYLTHLKTLCYSANTVGSYQKDLNAFNIFLQYHRLNELLFSSDDARLYLINMRKKGLRVSSIRRHISTLKGYYHFLMKHELVKTNPFTYISPIRGAKRLPHQLFYSDIMAMLEHCSNDLWGLRDRAIIESLYSTGCRAFELIALNKNDVLGRSALNIKGKGNKNRFIFFNKKAQDAISCYLSHKGLGEKNDNIDGQRSLFINHHGTRLTTRGLYYIVKEYEQFLPHGRKVGVHAFRHSFASHLLNEGASLRGVQELLGHSSLSSTQIYTHVGLDRIKELYRSAHPHARKRIINKKE